MCGLYKKIKTRKRSDMAAGDKHKLVSAVKGNLEKLLLLVIPISVPMYIYTSTVSCVLCACVRVCPYLFVLQGKELGKVGCGKRPHSAACTLYSNGLLLR